jgi:Rap1a immunity proteins
MNSFRVAIFAVAMSVAMAEQGFCSSITGSQLLKWCSPTGQVSAQQTYDLGLCEGYIFAISDASECGFAVDGYSFQPPQGGTLDQFVKVSVKWLQDHPEKLHFAAEGLVAQALSKAFPCP